MANLKASKIDIRKIERRTSRNVQIRSRLKTLSKKVTKVTEGDDAAASKAAVSEYLSALEKASKTGIVHKNKVSRHKARYAKFLAA